MIKLEQIFTCIFQVPKGNTDLESHYVFGLDFFLSREWNSKIGKNSLLITNSQRILLPFSMSRGRSRFPHWDHCREADFLIHSFSMTAQHSWVSNTQENYFFAAQTYLGVKPDPPMPNGYYTHNRWIGICVKFLLLTLYFSEAF